MALISPHQGENTLLARMMNTGDKVFLYTNNVTLSDTTVIGDFNKVAGTGSPSPAEKTLSSSWTYSSGTATYNSGTSVDFVFTGSPSGFTIYGYGVENSAGTAILWAEAFSTGPFSIGISGGTISVILKITLT